MASVKGTSDGTHSRPTGGIGRTTPGKAGSTTFLAAIGLIWFAVSVVVIARWVGSDHFTPAPKIGPDEMESWRLIALRIFEVISLVCCCCSSGSR